MKSGRCSNRSGQPEKFKMICNDQLNQASKILYWTWQAPSVDLVTISLVVPGDLCGNGGCERDSVALRRPKSCQPLHQTHRWSDNFPEYFSILFSPSLGTKRKLWCWCFHVHYLYFRPIFLNYPSKWCQIRHTNCFRFFNIFYFLSSTYHSAFSLQITNCVHPVFIIHRNGFQMSRTPSNENTADFVQIWIRVVPPIKKS